MSELFPFMRSILLPDVQHRIIRFILKNGPTSDFGICEKLSLSYADLHRDRTDYKYTSLETVDRELKELAGKGFLNFRESEDAEKWAGRTGVYHLTIFGLSALCIRNQDKPTEFCRTISGSYIHWKQILPLVLGKWEFFIEQGVEDVACTNLLNASHLLINEYYSFIKALFEWVSHKRQRKTLSEPTVSSVSDFYGQLQFSSGPKKPGFPSNSLQEDAFNLRYYVFDNPRLKAIDMKRWLLACKMDPDIHSYLKNQLQRKIANREVQVTQLETNLKLLQSY